MHYVIKRNATPSLIRAEAPGANVSKGGIYALLLWLLLNSNDSSNNQSRHLVGPTETQLTTCEKRRPNVTRCASQCLVRDRMQ